MTPFNRECEVTEIRRIFLHIACVSIITYRKLINYRYKTGYQDFSEAAQGSVLI